MNEPPRTNYERRLPGGVRQRILTDVYGDDYPVEADPRSYVTLSELHRIAFELRVGPGQSIVDLGCGHGGPGLWVARETGATLVGIDQSRRAIALAPERGANSDWRSVHTSRLATSPQMDSRTRASMGH
jgi:2-polyprenyl-3-methyl-5-hydroxy-6-metoxy-1,4-benzoquinol methylase